MRSTLAPSFLLMVLVAACGNGTGDEFGDGGDASFDGPVPIGDSGKSDSPSGFDSGPGFDSGGRDGSSGSGDSGGGSCTSTKCTTDTECQSACGTPPGGVYCCDTATQVCFPTSQPMCPASTGGGDGGTMY